MDTLYLTKDELKLWQKLPAALRKSWGGTVEEEKGTAWETAGELSTRRKIAIKKGIPPSVRLLGKQAQAKLSKNEPIDNLDFDAIPDDYLSTFFLLMGAVGMTAFIVACLATAESTDDLEAVRLLSRLRNTQLTSNATFSTSQHG